MLGRRFFFFFFIDHRICLPSRDVWNYYYLVFCFVFHIKEEEAPFSLPINNNPKGAKTRLPLYLSSIYSKYNNCFFLLLPFYPLRPLESFVLCFFLLRFISPRLFLIVFIFRGLVALCVSSLGGDLYFFYSPRFYDSFRDELQVFEGFVFTGRFTAFSLPPPYLCGGWIRV